MSIADTPYDYRVLQQIWDPSRIHDSRWQGRTPEACVRCHSKRSKCDGKKPCHRCVYSNAQCIYIRGDTRKSSALPATVKRLSRDVSKLEETLAEFNLDVMQLKAQEIASGDRSDKPPNPAVEENKSKKDSMNESFISHSSDKAKNKQWHITLSKNKMQIDIDNVHQLYELLTYLANSSRIQHPPKEEYRPVGTRAMTFRSTVQYPKWHSAHMLPVNASASISSSLDSSVDISPLVITVETESKLLESILLQNARCSALSCRGFSESSINIIGTQKSDSYMGLCYAIGAANAQHVFMHHPDTVTLPLFTTLNAHDFSRKLAQHFFDKAHELLVDRVVSDDPDALCADTVDALHAMTRYLIGEGRAGPAACSVSSTLRIAAQLDYHKALRGSGEAVVDVGELEKAIKWNLLACTDQALAAACGTPAHTAAEDTHLDLVNVTVRAPTDMPEERLQRLHESLYLAKASAICRDYLEAWYGESALEPTGEDLDRFLAAFTCWAQELPPSLCVDPASTESFKSPSALLVALNVQLHYQTFLIELYHPFLPSVHVNPSSLPPDLPRRAERACSDAAFEATRLVRAYVRAAGGCAFPIGVYSVAVGAHIRFAEFGNETLRRLHRVCVASVARMLRGTREWEVEDGYFRALVKYVDKFMAAEGIDADTDAED
ncbi:hypothetical protein BC937DRAFT_90646 [Endogone sp. FLAS-F59071]|nr:hypothetical protein BC937DRAFT_90646 [Endogone sp. FLAS-F59071]|eukprot:RUS22015.1 hypothetical protein BC937DRAFT_90646 [Endogone sp. FLAS-F59071]